jgi:hypothetical protein
VDKPLSPFGTRSSLVEFPKSVAQGRYAGSNPAACASEHTATIWRYLLSALVAIHRCARLVPTGVMGCDRFTVFIAATGWFDSPSEHWRWQQRNKLRRSGRVYGKAVSLLPLCTGAVMDECRLR